MPSYFRDLDVSDEHVKVLNIASDIGHGRAAFGNSKLVDDLKVVFDICHEVEAARLPRRAVFGLRNREGAAQRAHLLPTANATARLVRRLPENHPQKT